MKLFLVQDADRPAYIIAENYDRALAAWNSQIAKENHMDDANDVDPPSGIQMVADRSDLIIFAPADRERVVFNALD